MLDTIIWLSKGAVYAFMSAAVVGTIMHVTTPFDGGTINLVKYNPAIDVQLSSYSYEAEDVLDVKPTCILTRSLSENDLDKVERVTCLEGY